MSDVRTGGCLCGAVRYEVRGEPVHVGRCHCTDCRKESGSAFTVYGQWPADRFTVTGELELITLSLSSATAPASITIG